jgi:putative PEP-CTERM system TPR-repeat lipoprotein
MSHTPHRVRVGLMSRAMSCLFVGAFVGVFVAGCHRDAPADHVAQGKALAAKADHRGAVIEFKNALQSDPNSGETRFLLGRELLAQGDPKSAEIELQKAYDGKYDPDLVAPLLAKSQLAQGQTDKVINFIGSAKITSPEATAEMQTLLGAALLSLNKMDDAMAAFAAADKAVPGYPDALLGEARGLAVHGDTAGAAKVVDGLLAKNPTSVEALTFKGDLARARGDKPTAIDAYLAAIKQNPRAFMARLNLAGSYIASNQLDLAQQQVDELKKQAPKQPGVNYMDALIAFNKKDYQRASDAITVSINGAPNSGTAQLLAGAIATSLNQPVQAEQHLREAVKANPNNLYGRKLLVALYVRQHDAQKAEEILAPALAAAPNDGGLISLAGEVALMKGDFAAASTNFDKAAKINPGDANARTQGAAVDFARGDEAAGFAELEAASKASSNNPNPDIALVLARIQHRDFDKALAAWKTLQQRQPDNAITYNLRAAIDMGKNDIPAARKALEHALELQPTYFPAAANLAALDVRDHNIEAARQRYKTLLAKDPSNLSALLALAQFEAANGADASVVVGLLKEARRTNPNSERAVATLATYYVTKNDPRQALSIAQEGLASSPNNPTYLDLVGQLLLETGSTDQALATYRKLVSLNPDSLEYQMRLGQAQVAGNQADQALQTYTAALRNRPEASQAQAVAVTSLIRAGKTDEATHLYDDIKKQTPNSPVLPELEADLKLTTKQYADAAGLYKKVLATKPTTNVAIKMYSSLYLDKRQADASAFLADWIKAHPKDSAIRMFDADVALRAKDYPHAIQSYRAVLEAEPNNAVVLNNLSWAMWQQKDPQALTYAQKANAIAPDSPNIADTLGWMLVEQGQTKRGIEVLAKASASAPDHRDITLHLAKAQIKDGQKDEAKNTLQALVKAAPDSAEGKESKDLLTTL